LYYGETKLATSPTWTLTGKKVTFSNVNFDILTEETPLTVKLITTAINADGGMAVAGVVVDEIALTDALGKESGNTITITPVTQDSKEFDIVPTTITASVKDVLATSATLVLNVNRGANTTTGSAIARATLEGLTFSVLGNNGGLASFRVELNDAVVAEYTAAGALSGGVFNDKLLSAGDNELKVYFTQSGAINTPSYTVRLTNATYSTNVDANVATFSSRIASALNIISK